MSTNLIWALLVNCECNSTNSLIHCLFFPCWPGSNYVEHCRQSLRHSNLKKITSFTRAASVVSFYLALAS